MFVIESVRCRQAQRRKCTAPVTPEENWGQHPSTRHYCHLFSRWMSTRAYAHACAHTNTFWVGTLSTVTTFTAGCWWHYPHHPCVLSSPIFVLAATCPAVWIYHDFFTTYYPTAGQGLHFICKGDINSITSVCSSIKEPIFLLRNKAIMYYQDITG